VTGGGATNPKAYETLPAKPAQKSVKNVKNNYDDDMKSVKSSKTMQTDAKTKSLKGNNFFSKLFGGGH
jgi:hypothetical protein